MGPASEAFSVRVNGQPVYTQRFMSYAYAHFAFAGQVRVEVTFREPITAGVAVTPSKYGIQPSVDGRTLAFSLDQPRKLFLRVNLPAAYNYWSRRCDQHFLVLFAEALETGAPQVGQTGVDSLLDHGADASGERDSAPALRAALAACPQGGTVYVPDGRYRLDSPVKLDRPGLTLYLAGNALLWRPAAPDGLLVAADDLTLRGRGTIEAASYALRTASGRQAVHRVKIEDLVLRDSYISREGEYHMIARFTLDDFVIRGVKGLGCPQNETYGKQRDGLALDDSTRGVVEDCFVWSGDDAFYVWSWESPSAHIVVRNCAFRAEGGASAMKDMSQHLIEDLQFLDCVSLRGALQIDCRIPRGKQPPTPFGSQRGIVFRNIDIEELAHVGIAAFFGTQLMDADCQAVLDNVRFIGFYPGRNQFIVRGTDRVQVAFRRLQVGNQVVASRDDVARVGFQPTWEGAAHISFSAEQGAQP